MIFLTTVASFFEGLGKRHRLLPWLLAYVALLPLPFILTALFSEYLIDLANRACLFILLAVGLNIVKGEVLIEEIKNAFAEADLLIG